MKKIIIILIAVMTASVSLIVLSHVTNSENSFLMENVEALACDESGDCGYTAGEMCSQTGTKGGWRMKLCANNCSGNKGDYDMDRVGFCPGK